MFIHRKVYLDKIKPLIDVDIIKVLTGMRRSGKSVILKQIMDELKKDKNIIFINFESREYEKIRNHEDLMEHIYSKVKPNERYYLFFDEIQNVENWELAIGACYTDLDCDIYLTGSNSNMLSGELTTHLTGRFIEIKIYPFSFKEFLEYNNKNNIQLSEFEQFGQYLKFGGLPVLFNIPTEELKRDYLMGLFNTIVNVDIRNRYNIKNEELFNKLSIFLIENMSRNFSGNSIKKYLKNSGVSVNVETINKYIGYYVGACFLNKVKREDFRGKKILKTNEKYFLTDHSFREIYFNNNEDISQVLENIVYMEMLRRGYQITIGKIKDKEVDFICKKSGEVIYIQVAYLLADDKIIEREFGQLAKINDNFPKYVLSMDNFDFSRQGIKHLNIIDFLKIPKI